MKEYKAPEKITQKITRDGVVSENHSTGEAGPISPMHSSSEQSTDTAKKVLDQIDAFHSHPSAQRKAGKEKQIASDGVKATKRATSHLQFTEDELATPALQKNIEKSKLAADRLDMAREAVPKQKKLVRKRLLSESTRKGNTRLCFKKSEKAIQKVKHNPFSSPLQEVGAAIHGKVRDAEKENVGIEGGHAVEQLGEKMVGKGFHLARDGVRYHKLKPYRSVVRAEKSAINANAAFLYQKALHNNPALATSNPVSRLWQKRQIKRSYVKQLKNSEKAVEKTGGVLTTATQKIKNGIKKTGTFARRHRKHLLALLGLGFVLLLLLGGVQSCASMFGGTSSSVMASSYLSEDMDMLAAESSYSTMEAELQYELDNFETLHTGYDEYHFDLDEIGHDPYVLTSILSALHNGIFTINDVQGDLVTLFEKQYILTQTETVEVRYRTETDTWTDENGDTHTETYQVAYNYYILDVKLVNFNLSHVPVYVMDENTLGLYATYMSTLGNRTDLFPTAGFPNSSSLKEPTYYAIPAEVLENETFATLITEAEKYLGYPYVWGGGSPSTSFDCSGFVSYVLTNSGLCNTGRLGAQSLYNISAPVSAGNARPGDLVFFVGTYDTPGVSHVGIYVGNNMMLHCGDPISYTSINTTYWQSHFYAFARPPY